MKCPKCKDFIPQMSGVRFVDDMHGKGSFYLCFNCKEWFNEKGEFVQTI